MVKRPQLGRSNQLEGAVEPSLVRVDPGEIRTVFTDYIPPDGIPLPPDRIREPESERPQVLPNRDYVSPDEMKEIMQRVKARIKDEAKRIWNESKKDREQYELAKVIVDRCTPEDRASPSVDLARAIRIVEQGVPMTKEKAIAEAKRVVSAKSKLEAGQFWIG